MLIGWTYEPIERTCENWSKFQSGAIYLKVDVYQRVYEFKETSEISI